MANEMNKKVEKFMDDNPEYRGKFVGYTAADGLGISRIDDRWFQCDRYLVELEDLIEILKAKKRI